MSPEFVETVRNGVDNREGKAIVKGLTVGGSLMATEDDVVDCEGGSWAQFEKRTQARISTVRKGSRGLRSSSTSSRRSPGMLSSSYEVRR